MTAVTSAKLVVIDRRIRRFLCATAVSRGRGGGTHLGFASDIRSGAVFQDEESAREAVHSEWLPYVQIIRNPVNRGEMPSAGS